MCLGFVGVLSTSRLRSFLYLLSSLRGFVSLCFFGLRDFVIFGIGSVWISNSWLANAQALRCPQYLGVVALGRRIRTAKVIMVCPEGVFMWGFGWGGFADRGAIRYV